MAETPTLKTTCAAAKELKGKGIHYVDVGTSGGVWGLERGYCMMIGGPEEAVQQLDPIFKTLAPGRGDIPRTPGRDKLPGTAEDGYLYCGPSGAGHFVKMVHNGIEYGLMQAYAEGFDIFRNATSKELPEDYRYDLNLADIAEVWRRGSVVSSWLLDLTAMALAENPTPRRIHRLRAGFRRRPLDHPGCDRGSGAGRRPVSGALHSFPLPPGAHLRGEGAFRHAAEVRRPRGTRGGKEVGLVSEPRIKL